jgi:hypothetical protein
LFDRFEGAHEWFLNGLMDVQQADQHRANLSLLRKHIPLLKQLGLRLPGGSLLDALDDAATAPSGAKPA